MKDMCAECGADLRKLDDDNTGGNASVSCVLSDSRRYSDYSIVPYSRCP